MTEEKDYRAKQICFFCGKPLSNEKCNDEHIIPKWLLNHLGILKNKISLGIDFKSLENKGETKPYLTEWSKFKLRVHKSCNEKYGKNLEKKVKPIVLNLLSLQKISKTDAIILLDWFDKVRIGIWYYQLAFNNTHDVKPKFSLDQRLGKADRAILIYRIKDWSQVGINFFYSELPISLRVPSILGIRINEFIFLNVSKEYFFSNAIGLPSINYKYFDTDHIEKHTILHGQTGINKFPFDKFEGSKTIFQGIHREYFDFEKNGLYHKDNRIVNGITDIYTIDKDGVPSVLNELSISELEPQPLGQILLYTNFAFTDLMCDLLYRIVPDDKYEINYHAIKYSLKMIQMNYMNMYG